MADGEFERWPLDVPATQIIAAYAKKYPPRPTWGRGLVRLEPREVQGLRARGLPRARGLRQTSREEENGWPLFDVLFGRKRALSAKCLLKRFRYSGIILTE